MRAIRVAIFALVIIACSMTISASPLFVCPPSLTQDGIPVSPTCPGNDYQIKVETSTFFISFNDNPLSQGEEGNGYTGDGDVNDDWATGTISKTNTPGWYAVYLTWGGALADWNNSITLGMATVNSTHTSTELAGFYAVGSILNFIEITPDGNYSSIPNLNVDCQNYSYESQTFGNSPGVPEPGVFGLVGVGLALLGVLKFRGKEKNEKT